MRKLLLLVALLCTIPARAQQVNSLVSNFLQYNIQAASTNCTVANACVWMKLPAGTTTVSVTLSGTFAGTFLVEESGDGGNTWTTVSTYTATVTAAVVTVTSLTDVRVRCSVYSSGQALTTLSAGGNQINLNAGANGSVTPSAANTLLSSKCGGGNTNCFQANGNTRWTGDCVTTSGLNTVSSASAAFTPADNGKHIFCSDVNSADGAAYQNLCITGTFTFVSSTSGTVSNNATNSCAGTSSKYLLVIGFKDTTAAQNAFAASLTSNATLNGPPNSLVVDCGTYLVDAIPFNANANNFQHNITFSVLAWYPHCVTWVISDDFNYSSCVSSVCFYFVSNGVEKSLPPDWLQQSGFGVFRDMAILGPGLLQSSQAGVAWVEPLRELRNVQIANLPGPSSTPSTLVKMTYYTSGVYNCDIEPNSTNTTNPPIALDVNAHNVAVMNNSFYNSVGTFLQVETSNYAVLIRDNYFGSVSTQTTPLINVVSGVLDTQITGNTFSLPGAANIGVQGAGNYTVTGRNILIVTNATSIGIKNLSGGQAMVGGNLYNGAGVPINNAGVLNHSYGQDWTPASTAVSVNSGTWIPLQSESGTSACVTSTKAITFTWTSANGGGYRAGAPTVVISDETTAGGVKAGSITSSGFTATCTGATDTFDYTVTPNTF